MEGLRNTPGFFGTNASLLADLNLVIQIVLFIVLCIGVMAQRKQKYHWHDKLQAPVVVLNFFFILLIMWPAFQGISGEIPANLSQTYVLVPTLHAIFGLIAEGLAIYCLLAGFKILPRKIGELRYWMWACFVFWTASIMFGVGTYIVWYTAPPAAVAPAGDNIVGEHDEEALEAPVEAPTDAEATATPEAIPADDENVVSEHDEETVDTPTEAEATATPETATDDENIVGEHDEETVDEPVEAPTDTPVPAEVTATATLETIPVDENVVSEHDEEALEAPVVLETPTQVPTEAPTDTPIPAEVEATATLEPTATTESAAEPDNTVSEHDEAEALIEPTPIAEEGAAGLDWQAITPSNIGPGERYKHGMVYNLTDNKIYLFGGQGAGQTYNDVWVFDLESLSWQELATDSPDKPPARHTTVLSLDRAGENLYVATGQNSSGVLNDVWVLNLASETWQDVGQGSSNAPAARYGNPGGFLNGDLVLTHGFGSTRYDDTWVFDLDTGQWENITPVGALPLKRCLFAAATAPSTLVIHGGCASGFGDCYLEDTWVLNTSGGGWRELTTAEKPSGRQHQTLVQLADAPDSQQYLLYGGQDASRAALTDVWLLDLSDDSWQALGNSTAVEARYNHQSVWVPNLGMVVYGGRNSGGGLADMWLLNWSQ